MSSSKDENNDKPTTTEDNTPSMPELPSMTELPDLETVQKTWRSSISRGAKAVVQSANAALANLEHTADAVRKPVHSGLETVEHTSTQVATQARVAYERRHEFGPYWVLGSFVSVGGFFALRRGKLPGLLLGTLAGSAAYMALYEPLAETPTFGLDWPFQNLTRSVGGSGSHNNDKKD